MGARLKLNCAFINSVLLVATMIGLSTGSLAAFAVTAALLITAQVAANNIRP
jgi:hypothetical protein